MLPLSPWKDSVPQSSFLSDVSVLVPVIREDSLFEETLASVLQHRQPGQQIVVVHNGSYDDPFELAGEVEFATARSANLVDLIRDGLAAVDAPLVHVIAPGMIATEGWLDASNDVFADPQTAAWIPDLIAADGTLTTAGWADTPRRLCQPGQRGAALQVAGFYLDGFTMRTTLLYQLFEVVAPALYDPLLVSYAFGCLLHRTGALLDQAQGCTLERHPQASSEHRFESDSRLQRGRDLAAIQALVLNESFSVGGFTGLAASLFGGSGAIAETVGMSRYQQSLPMMRRAIDVQGFDLSQEQGVQAGFRRAA